MIFVLANKKMKEKWAVKNSASAQSYLFLQVSEVLLINHLQGSPLNGALLS